MHLESNNNPNNNLIEQTAVNVESYQPSIDYDYAFTDEELEVLYEDFTLFAENCLTIENKKAQLQPFIFNQPQKKVDEVVAYYEKQHKPLRFIVLKARQEGISTYFEGKIFHRTITNLNRKALIVGHVSKASANLFKMANTYYKYLPKKLRPTTKYSNRSELVFGEINSSLEVDTAENNDNLGRSGTLHDLHATEVAFWRDASKAMLALLQTIPEEEGTLVVIESTANGIGGYFYDTWQDAVNGENDYIPIFLSWFDMPEYSRPFNSDEERLMFAASLDTYEKDLLRKFPEQVTLEGLNWRRYYIRNKCNGDAEQFKQEYPSTPEEAFIASGRPVFDAVMTYRSYLDAKPPIKRGNLLPIKNKAGEIIAVKWQNNPKGYIRLWIDYTNFDEIHEKKEDYRFAAGCDVAEGLEQGDFSVIRVLDRRYMRVGLVWHGHISADLLGDEQYKIQLFLKGKVYTNTEMNNHGLTTIKRASQLGVYQYYREDFKSGSDIGEQKDIIGTKTNIATKPDMINNLDTFMREKHFHDDEKEFWGECLTFVRNEKGQMQAQNKDKDPATKCFDDRVMAGALMIRCHLWMPSYIIRGDRKLPRWYDEEFGIDTENEGTTGLKHSSMGV